MEGGLLIVSIYVLAIAIAGTFVMAQDKALARKHSSADKRISEGWLFFLAILGGGLGIYAGMFLFRHKTQKITFLVGIPLLLLQQLLLLSFYFNTSFLL